MAIVLDSVVMGRPPVIQSAIGTNGQITMGGKDLQAAQDLALVLRAGALPVPLKVAEVRQIGASLGQDSIVAGVRAGVIAVLLVVVIMLVYYRFSGVLAVGGLALYMLYTMAVLAGFDAVLTLPGAGRVRSVDRYRGRRQRADLRAHPRRAGSRQDAAHGDRRGIPARHERHHRLQRDDGPHRGRALSVRDRAR